MVHKHERPSDANLVKYIVSSSSPLYKFIEIARRSVLQGAERFRGIDNGLVEEAREAFHEFKFGLDATTPYFTREQASMVLGSGKKRVIAVVQGQFEGDRILQTTIGYDLGANPYMLYTRKGVPKDQTIDDYLTRAAVMAYMKSNVKPLKRLGVDSFRIKYSAFYYFRDSDLRYPLRKDDGSISMKHLLPLVADTILSKDHRTGFVGLSRVRLPSEEEYAALALPFLSHRLKSTLPRKFRRQLLLPEIPEKEVVTDAAAHRIRIATIEELRDLETRLIEDPSTIKIIEEKCRDNYRNPRRNGFRMLKIVGVFETNGKIFVREVQEVDQKQYYRNDINPNDPAHHRQQEKKEELPERQLARIPEPIQDAIIEIFGKSTIEPISLEDAIKAA